MTDRKLSDGTYQGKSFKFPGRFIVSVDVKDGRIAAVRIDRHLALRKYTDMLGPMIERMIAEQKADVDVVTGATMSSRALGKAVGRALEQASGGE